MLPCAFTGIEMTSDGLQLKERRGKEESETNSFALFVCVDCKFLGMRSKRLDKC